MAYSNRSSYEFGPFELNTAQRVLTRDGEVISLPPKAMDVLLILVRRAGELVEKDELMREVWPASFVEEGNLTQSIFALRKALRDNRSDAQYVETVSRRGYRFVAHVRFKTTDDVAAQATTLAVLPFVNATGNPELDYLADGIGENTIKGLSQISRLRVMARSSVGRFKGKELDLQHLAKELRVDSILVGKIISTPSGLVIEVELIEAGKGWLLWGENFDCSAKDILEIQDEIVKHISTSLGLELSGDEEKQITARYTESSRAYQAYLEGRFFWSRFTLQDIEKAIALFRRAIDLDPNYALAYSAIIDCYLRLTTNYVPNDESSTFEPSVMPDLNKNAGGDSATVETLNEADNRLRLRHEWDWKGAERELRRARALKSVYPAAHQWHAAYLFVRQLYQDLHSKTSKSEYEWLPRQVRSIRLTAIEEVQVFCAIAREQIVVGNFVGARIVLERWLPAVGWPTLDHLDPHTAADLLFTLGNLVGVLSLIGRINRGVKRAEAYLNGAIAMLEQLGSKVLASEARIELARCYYREGLFDESREILALALRDLPLDQTELRSLCLAVYGCVDRDSGRLIESLEKLRASAAMETGQLVTGFSQLQLATTLKELAISEGKEDYYVAAGHHFQQALYEFEAIGNHTHSAATENNFGYLLLSMGLFVQSEKHLLRALTLFTSFSNDHRAAQVNETLAQLYLSMKDLPKAQDRINKAVAALEATDGDAVLAEALNTKGVIASRQLRFIDARNSFESSYRVAERCGDIDRAARALLSLFDEMLEQLTDEESLELGLRLRVLKSRTNQLFLLERITQTLTRIQSRLKKKKQPR